MNPIQQQLLALANTPADKLSTQSLAIFSPKCVYQSSSSSSSIINLLPLLLSSIFSEAFGQPSSNPYNMHSAQQKAASNQSRDHREAEPPQKRSRWNSPGTKAFIPGVPHLIPRGLEKDCMEALLGTSPHPNLSYLISIRKN